jgi:hypothetical protein
VSKEADGASGRSSELPTTANLRPRAAPRSATTGKKTSPPLSLGAIAAGVRNRRQGGARPQPSRLTTDQPLRGSAGPTERKVCSMFRSIRTWPFPEAPANEQQMRVMRSFAVALGVAGKEQSELVHKRS